MPFYQNVFGEEFRGSLPFADRQYSLTFAVPANKTNGNVWVAFNPAPYNFSTYNTLTVNFAIDTNFRNYSSVAINIAGAVPAATTGDEVVALLNANVTFSDFFTATLQSYKMGGKVAPPVNSQTNVYGTTPPYAILINSKRDKTRIRAYISNTGAEKIMRFNRYAGVAEFPQYYDRHTINNRFLYPDGQAMLIRLDETDPVYDQPIITDAGFNYSAMKEDWELLRGRVEIFNFKKITVDGSDRITEVIEYPAGALAGDLARKTAYVYTGANTSPDQITQIPYTLTSGDLVTP